MIYRIGYYEFSGPAAVDRETRTVYVNAPVWDTLDRTTKVFVLAHEYAHCLVGSDETAADALAFEIMRDGGYSLKAITRAVIYLMPYQTREQYQRAYSAVLRALWVDARKGNKAAYRELQHLSTENLPRQFKRL